MHHGEAQPEIEQDAMSVTLKESVTGNWECNNEEKEELYEELKYGMFRKMTADM